MSDEIEVLQGARSRKIEKMRRRAEDSDFSGSRERQ